MPHLYQEIAESLRRRIASGELAPGARLPSVREAAQQWRCTPGTVSRAYRQLAHEGLIGGHRGGGTRVLDNVLAERPPELKWAELVNRAEQFLLEALSAGHSPSESQTALGVAVSRWRTLQEQTPDKAGEQPPKAGLRFAGSHDLAVELLLQRLKQSELERPLAVHFVGSLGGLIALARDEADIAGVHLWDSTTGTYNLPYVRRLLPGRRLALVTFVYRSLGLIVPPGNPQAMRQLNDLTGAAVRWVNRQRGSGTRVWLDDQLHTAGIDPELIQGYEQEEATHMGVAQAVHDGQATAGLGIQAAAAAYGLHFIPLTEEIYQLVVSEALWETATWQGAMATIRSNEFASAVVGLGGYDISATGEVNWA